MPCTDLHLLLKPASDACNMACRYCFYASLSASGAQSGRVMTEETARLVISRAFETGARRITFAFQGGEPTLAGLPFLRAFVAEAERQNTRGAELAYALQTNGLRLDAEWAAFLAEKRVLVGLSMDGGRDLHDSLRPDAQGRGTYDRVRAAARLLADAGVEHNLLCVVSSRLARHGAAAYNALKRTGCRFLQFIPCVEPFEGLPGAGAHFLSAEDYLRFLMAVFPLWYRDFCDGKYVSVRYFDNLVRMLAGEPPELCGMAGVCPGQLIVESDGTVYPCDFYAVPELACGNLRERSIEELVSGATRREFVRASYAVDPACRECPVAALCRGGCRRDRQESPTGPVGRNRYCAAYRAFLPYAMPYLQDVLRRLSK